MMKYVTSFRVIPESRSNKLKEISLVSVSGIWFDDTSSVINLEPSTTGSIISDPKPCPKALDIPMESITPKINNERKIFGKRIFKRLRITNLSLFRVINTS